MMTTTAELNARLLEARAELAAITARLRPSPLAEIRAVLAAATAREARRRAEAAA